ncbi:MAG: CCA tRNA nucleotidyltransferase [Lachnospiraceae bacterium]|nr:CCA tRNA nucleotidyltransferase [Lachnospiraceae bacterium]
MQEFPAKVRTIISKLQEAGYEAYAVGGCVRDSYMGRVPNDWDITTNAVPEQVKAIFRRTIDVGIEHGTVKIMMGADGYEVTTYRIDGEYEDNRHPKEVTFTPDLREDLRRRDFTINAMAYSEKTGLVDLFGGMQDLRDGIVRAVGDPAERFNEDALRMLRALRFSAAFDFKIEDKTAEAISRLCKNLSNISAERIRQELEKLICSDHPNRLRQAYDLGVTGVIFPEWDAMTQCEQETPHHFTNVGDHTIVALDYIVEHYHDIDEREDRILRIATMLHDIAKPVKKFRGRDDADHFTGHPAEGVKMAEDFLRRLKYDNDTIKRVKKLVRFHDDTPELTYPAVRRFIVDVEVSNMENLMRLKYADLYAHTDYKREEKLERIETLDRMYRQIIQDGDALSVGELTVGGSDLIAEGIPAGPGIGAALSRLLEAVLDDPSVNEKEKLLDMIRGKTE